MPQFLFDTDHLTLYERGLPMLVQRVRSQPGAVGVSAVTMAESLKGRLGSLARRQRGPLCVVAFADLVNTVLLFNDFPVVDYDLPCDQLYQQLTAIRPRIGTQDLRIAAVALTAKAGERQVSQDGRSAVLLGDNVVNREWERRKKCLPHLAILAGIIGPPPHLPRQRVIHVSLGGPFSEVFGGPGNGAGQGDRQLSPS